MSAAVVGFPAESQTLQFMNETGVVNIYMIMMSYLFAPYNEADASKFDLDPNDKEMVRTHSSGSSG